MKKQNLDLYSHRVIKRLHVLFFRNLKYLETRIVSFSFTFSQNHISHRY